jgi:hypothetical protein
MKDLKKDEFWGTSVRRFITDGEEKHNEVGLIFINFRDSEDLLNVIEIVKHELTHLIDNKKDLRKIKSNLNKLITDWTNENKSGEP